MECGGANFSNHLQDWRHEVIPVIDFVSHAKAMGANAQKASSISELEAALKESRNTDRSTLILIETHPLITTEAGGHWWDVVVPEASARPEVDTARERYERQRSFQRAIN